jgi:DNA polymerase-3 subunit alpha
VAVAVDHTAKKSTSITTVTEVPVVPFVHLHNHSHYSLLDGLQKVPAMLDRVEELGMNAVALTDHGTLSGAVEFHNLAKKRGINPIIGLEAYVAPRGHLDKTAGIDKVPYHLILLAENNTGYQNLMKLVSIAQLEGYYYKPRVDRALLEQYHEGLIALSACAGGEVATHIRNGNMAEAEAVVRWYEATFGPGNYFLELQWHEHQWATQKVINDGKIALSKKTGVPVVLTADSHYSRHSDREAHETLLCVQTGKTLDDKDRMKMDMDLYITSGAEIAERWGHLPESYENTVKIAARCNVEIEQGKILIPTFPVPVSGLDERAYLHQLCWQGLAYRYGGIPKEDVGTITEERARSLVGTATAERLDFELGVIAKMGYDGYFLIVSDFINWGKNQGIIFGPGRGSAAGSIVAYVMNITDLDPMKYDLLFERFLNPDRISMPDIDIDIQDTRRGEVIEYVTEKYGQERVAQIITFGTMAARNAVRDTGRVLGMSYAEVDAIAKLIPQPVQGRHISLTKSIVDDPDLHREYTANPRSKRLIDLAIQLEGTIRSNGVHAAGVIIAPEPVSNYAPLQRAQKGGISAQYSMNYVEGIGLLKMDFLGLSNLTVINDALKIIKRVYGHTIDLPNLPLDDAPTYELLSRGDTTGVFQLESAGMKKYLRQLKPSVFDDIIAMVALYRPGPMQFIDDFIDRKHGRKAVTYEHPGMEAALGSTYGILVYQEQFMQISKDMCGFTGGQADTLRKAIGKKQLDTMRKMKELFIAGMIEKSGVRPEFAATFWDQLEAFADYCFNKSHSACYGLIAYQTAYLKAHYPAAFMAALMTSDFGNIDRIAIEVSESQRMGIKVLPPDVNESFSEFAVVKESGNIRFGLSAVKNVGGGAIEAILSAREEGGPYTSIEDFAKRVNARDCNKKAYESLAKSGAYDSMVSDRGHLLHNLELIVSYAQKSQKNALSGQIDIFGSLGAEENLPALRFDAPPQEVSAREMLSWEKELLGLYLSHHPLDSYASYLSDTTQPLAAISQEHDGKLATIGGMIIQSRKLVTKKGDQMAFATLEDRSGLTIELIVFPKAFEKSAILWESDRILAVSGKISARDREGRLTDEIQLLVDGAREIDYDEALVYKPMPGTRPPGFKTPTEPAWAKKKAATTPLSDRGGVALKPKTEAQVATAGRLVIQLPNLQDQSILLKVRDILSAAKGESEVYLVIGADLKKIKLPFLVSVSEALNQQLETIVGEGRVSLR